MMIGHLHWKSTSLSLVYIECFLIAVLPFEMTLEWAEGVADSGDP